jgi:hypothetical protein
VIVFSCPSGNNALQEAIFRFDDIGGMDSHMQAMSLSENGLNKNMGLRDLIIISMGKNIRYK